MSTTLTDQDQELIAAATDLIKQHYMPGKHKVAAAIRLDTGEIITSLNLEGSFGCIDTCAEQNALAAVFSAGKHNVQSIVAVKHPKPLAEDQTIKVVSPCGRCRELLCDYAPNATVLIPDGSTVSKRTALELLPFRYSKL